MERRIRVAIFLALLLPGAAMATVVVNGFAYQQCGSTWYQPQISGSTTTYIVVNPPR